MRKATRTRLSGWFRNGQASLKKWTSFGTLPFLLLATLVGGVGAGSAIANGATQYSCTVYKPPTDVIDNPLDERLLAGVKILEEQSGEVKDAIVAFNEVVERADVDDPRIFLARTNLVCAYLKQASIYSKSNIYATPTPNGNDTTRNANNPVCDLIDKVKRLQESIQMYAVLAQYEVPNVPTCDREFETGITTKTAWYPIKVEFSLPADAQIRSANLSNSDLYAQFATVNIQLKLNQITPRTMPATEVYCYEVSNIDGATSFSPEFGAMRLANNETYALIKLSNGWRLRESNGRNELIIVDTLQGLEVAKDIHIYTPGLEDEDHELVLDARFNREDSIEIEVPPGKILEIEITEFVTLASGASQEYEGHDFLYSIDPGQIYTLQEPFEQQFSGQLFMNGMSCKTFLATINAKTELGVAVIKYGDLVDGDVTSQSGNRWKFSGEANDSAVITMRSDEMCTTLEVYTQSGQPLDLNRDSSDSCSSQVSITLPETGDYFIVARGQDSGFGPYTLELQKNSCQSQSYELIKAGPLVNGYVSPDLSETWSFCGHVGDQVKITMHSSELDTFLEIYSPSGELIADNDDIYSNECQPQIYTYGDCDSQIVYEPLPETGKYTIVAKSIDGEGSYTLTLE